MAFSFAQIKLRSDCSGDFTGTQAAGAGVNVTRGTVHNCLYAHDIRFPSSVRSSMGVRNLDTEGYALTAEIAFCHLSAPPLIIRKLTENSNILSEVFRDCKGFFKINCANFE